MKRVIVVGAFMSAVLVPAAAGAAAANPGVGSRATSRPPGTRVSAPVRQGWTSPYVAASSRAQANRILAAVHRAAAVGDRLARFDGLTVRYGPCTLKPGSVYPRKYYDHRAVGFKPKTTCDIPVGRIHMVSHLRYAWYAWWFRAGPYFRSTAWGPAALALTQKKIHYYCTGWTKTTWAGETDGTITFRGRKYYATAYPTVRQLDCEAG